MSPIPALSAIALSGSEPLPVVIDRRADPDGVPFVLLRRCGQDRLAGAFDLLIMHALGRAPLAV